MMPLSREALLVNVTDALFDAVQTGIHAVQASLHPVQAVLDAIQSRIHDCKSRVHDSFESADLQFEKVLEVVDPAVVKHLTKDDCDDGQDGWQVRDELPIHSIFIVCDGLGFRGQKSQEI